LFNDEKLIYQLIDLLIHCFFASLYHRTLWRYTNAVIIIIIVVING